jgi:hypothetical protein
MFAIKIQRLTRNVTEALYSCATPGKWLVADISLQKTNRLEKDGRHLSTSEGK